MGVKSKTNINFYHRFDQINGDHPFKHEHPDGVVEYQVRKKKGGKLAYFNYNLAKDMGLIDKTHPHKMNQNLKQKVLDTFSIVIINEYDILNNIVYAFDEIKENTYMATRYLQLQHPKKIGVTSGDGRSIWNGCYKGSNGNWDVSSCGTGATILSPAAARNEKFYKTGDETISYGCGNAELLDGLSAALMSEILYNQGYTTERTLAVIDYGNGISVNVRAAKNLFRPSHFFHHVKQNNYEGLKTSIDFYIKQEMKNGGLSKRSRPEDCYDELFNRIIFEFANAVARFEADYLFVWLDWDGDNILMDAGIIDYGSVRQFGLFHHEYRYDDVERYSTNIKEQKLKAQYTIQTFAQLFDYLKTKKKKNIKNFQNDVSVKKFQKTFLEQKRYHMISKLGLSEKQTEWLTQKKKKLCDEFLKAYTYFERYKSSTGPLKVEDGISHDASFCVRDILREFPKYIMKGQKYLEFDVFIEILMSNYSTEDDISKTSYKNYMAIQFQKKYHEIINVVSTHFSTDKRKLLLQVIKRSNIINRAERITGNSIVNVTEQLLKDRENLNLDSFIDLMEAFVEEQVLRPNFKKKHHLQQSRKLRLLNEIVDDFREGL